MNRLAGMFWGLVFLAVPVLGVATFAIAPSINVWLPRDVSSHGYEIDSLFYFILVLTGIVFIATVGGISGRRILTLAQAFIW